MLVANINDMPEVVNSLASMFGAVCVRGWFKRHSFVITLHTFSI